MERERLINEIEDSRSWRRGENWLMTIAISLIILALSAGMDYSLGESFPLSGSIILWGSALIWVLFFLITHIREIFQLDKLERYALSLLKENVSFEYSEKITPAPIRWILSIIVLLLSFFIMFFSLYALIGASVHSDQLIIVAEMTLILFACATSIICAFLWIIPPRQKAITVYLKIKADKPIFVSYMVRR